MPKNRGHTLCIQTVYKQYPTRLWKGETRPTIGRLISIKDTKKFKKRGIVQPLTCWDHSNSEQVKSFLRLWSNISSWKVLQFCFSQVHQKRQIGVDLHTALFFFLDPLTFHSKRRFLIEFGNTHTSPKEVNNTVQSIFVLSQWIKMWLADSSLSLQRLHLLPWTIPSSLTCLPLRFFPKLLPKQKNDF